MKGEVRMSAFQFVNFNKNVFNYFRLSCPIIMQNVVLLAQSTHSVAAPFEYFWLTSNRLPGIYLVFYFIVILLEAHLLREFKYLGFRSRNDNKGIQVGHGAITFVIVCPHFHK